MFSREKRKQIYAKYDGHCAYCGDPIEYSKMQVDHIIPKSNFENTMRKGVNIPSFLKHLGIEDVNHDDNLNPSCAKCNKFKDSFHLELFRKELYKQLERANKYSANYRFAKKFNQVQETPQKIIFYFERHRIYNFDGEHHVFQFNSSEEKWFLNWVVMRGKYKKALSDLEQAMKEANYWRDKSYDLEKVNKDLIKAKRSMGDFDKQETERRFKMIEDFNNKHNKKNRKPKRKKGRRRR